VIKDQVLISPTSRPATSIVRAATKDHPAAAAERLW
jgi:hypothetical protein